MQEVIFKQQHTLMAPDSCPSIAAALALLLPEGDLRSLLRQSKIKTSSGQYLFIFLYSVGVRVLAYSIFIVSFVKEGDGCLLCSVIMLDSKGRYHKRI